MLGHLGPACTCFAVSHAVIIALPGRLGHGTRRFRLVRLSGLAVSARGEGIQGVATSPAGTKGAPAGAALQSDPEAGDAAWSASAAVNSVGAVPGGEVAIVVLDAAAASAAAGTAGLPAAP